MIRTKTNHEPNRRVPRPVRVLPANKRAEPPFTMTHLEFAIFLGSFVIAFAIGFVAICWTVYE